MPTTGHLGVLKAPLAVAGNDIIHEPIVKGVGSGRQDPSALLFRHCPVVLATKAGDKEK
jgi:hypothetical protein